MQQRSFGSNSEGFDPAQLKLLLDEIPLGKSEASPKAGDEVCSPEEPTEEKVAANPNNDEVIGEEHADELDVVPPSRNGGERLEE